MTVHDRTRLTDCLKVHAPDKAKPYRVLLYLLKARSQKMTDRNFLFLVRKIQEERTFFRGGIPAAVCYREKREVICSIFPPKISQGLGQSLT